MVDRVIDATFREINLIIIQRKNGRESPAWHTFYDVEHNNKTKYLFGTHFILIFSAFSHVLAHLIITTSRSLRQCNMWLSIGLGTLKCGSKLQLNLCHWHLSGIVYKKM